MGPGRERRSSPSTVAGRRRFFARPAPAVARDLLGWELVVGPCAVVITETEAYTDDDPASHSFRGMTSRNRSMFSVPGTVYVYLSYGVHWCANISTGTTGVGEAVLLRGGVPTRGIATMEVRRPAALRPADLTAGPGRLTQALGIDRTFDGTDVTAEDAPMVVRPRFRYAEADVQSTTRIGITKAVDRPWRFVVGGVLPSGR